jgi:UDP-2,4-diacetamido-2,4,6-trideoxy-beta-L-altropyranose hydrolase
MSKPRVIIRVDGNRTIGLGHIMRMRALAAMLGADFECEFAVAVSGPEAISLLSDRPTVHGLDGAADADALVRLCRTRRARIVVLDGYRFGLDLQNALQSAGLRVVVIDDLANGPVAAEVVINL